MTGAAIKSIAYYLPEKILDNQDLENEFPGWDSQKIEEKVGIKKRHIAADDETALDMGEKASLKLLAHTDKDSIDFIISCTQSPDYFLPANAVILQDRLHLRTDIGGFDLNLGCSGYIYGVMLAKSIIQSGIAENILLVTTETLSKHIHPKDRGNRIIFGDGAAATLVTKQAPSQIFEFVFGTDGSGYANLIIPNGRMRNRYQDNAEEKEDKNGNIRTDNHFFMNGPEVFNFTIASVPTLVKNILEKNQLTIDQIDCVVFHQANKYMLEYLRNKLKIPNEKFYINMWNVGNTVSATIPIALKECLDQGVVKKGAKVLIVGFGVGYSWGGTVIQL